MPGSEGAKKAAKAQKKAGRCCGSKPAAMPKAKAKKSKRTIMYSDGGKKLYAVRDSEGKFKDIQTYKRAHTQDMKRDGKDES